MSKSPSQSVDSGESDESREHLWSAPGCRVRVDDGAGNVTWVDLKRPYALIGAHACCTLRIRGSHVPEVAYFVCCLKDRVEIWPTAAIAFPRWGAIPSDVQVVVGPFSLTFHPTVSSETSRALPSFAADCEIETRISWSEQSFFKMFRRPVTIIGDHHPSVLRLHGRGMSACHYAAVVQDQSLWLVDLSARRMKRSERVRHLHPNVGPFLLGEAKLDFVSARPLATHHDEHEVGIGFEDASADLHAWDGNSVLDHELHVTEQDPSASFIGSVLRKRDDETTDPGRSFQSDVDDSTHGNSESHSKPDQPGTNPSQEDGGPSLGTDSGFSDTLMLRIDGGFHEVPQPSHPTEFVATAVERNDHSADSVLELVETALGLVDAAVQGSAVIPSPTSPAVDETDEVFDDGLEFDGQPTSSDSRIGELDRHAIQDVSDVQQGEVGELPPVVPDVEETSNTGQPALMSPTASDESEGTAIHRTPLLSSERAVVTVRPPEPANSQRETVPTSARIDAELLTSHVTTRLTQIGRPRSILQQVIRWSAITIGIIVPVVVVVWVVQRIYTDWY